MADVARHGPWRSPGVESDDLYPGLSVNDGRVTGSIVVGRTRLPLWAFVGVAVTHGWGEVEEGWEPSDYGYSAADCAAFLGDLLEMRGEFGRLLLVLADVERRERKRDRMSGKAWWDRKKDRRRVAAALRACLAAVEDSDG